MSVHERAWCLRCTWEHDGPGADQAAHRHTTSKAAGHVQHPTSSAAHPKALCTPECLLPRRRPESGAVRPPGATEPAEGSRGRVRPFQGRTEAHSDERKPKP